MLLGVTHADTEADADRLADKVRALRVFADADGRMNEPLGEREVLCVSQFTLYGDTRKGNRPAYVAAARPEVAEPLYERFCERLGAQRGVFGAHMDVELVNDGPVTVLIEVPAARLPRHADLPLRRRAAAGRACRRRRPCRPSSSPPACGSRPRTTIELGEAGEIHWFPDRTWSGPHLRPRDRAHRHRPRALRLRVLRARRRRRRELYAWADYTPDIAEDHPEWRMDISQEVVGGWRGERGRSRR